MSALRISTDPGELDVALIHAFLTGEAYWSRGIPLEVVQRAITGSLCFGAYRDGRQVGFARVVSDYATFGYLSDVFVLPAYRGNGYAKQLMAAVMAEPRLQGLRRFMLMTADAHGLYAGLGFQPLANPGNAMEIARPDLYLSSAAALSES